MARIGRLLSFVLAASWLASAATADTGYIGSKPCFACHADIYRSFLKTGMGRSMQLADDLDAGSLPTETSVPIANSARVARVFRDASGWHQSEIDPNVFESDHKLVYVVGSGANGLTFLVRRGNYLFQAPLSFYSKTGKWDLSPGYEQLDLGFSRLVPEECIACHAGRARPVPNRAGQYADPPFEQLAIGCENCHGPGESHVKTLGRRAGLIVNPGRLPPRLADNICMNCHQTGDTRVLQPGKTYQDFRPGEWLIDTAVIIKAAVGGQKESDLLEHYSAMQASRCFHQSGGKLSCVTCHDPHTEPRAGEAPAYFRAKCLACHTDQSCPLPLKARNERIPPNDCAGCHMPKRKIAQISHSALTNHRIPAREGEPVTEEPSPEIGGLIVVNRRPDRVPKLPETVLLRAYGALASRNPQYQQRYLDTLENLRKTAPQDPFVQVALGHKALADGNNEDARQHLAQALPLGDSTVYLDLAQALIRLGRANEAIDYLKRGVEIDPYNAVMQKTLILQYINSGRYSDARQAMQQYVQSFPEDSFMRGLLARVQ